MSPSSVLGDPSSFVLCLVVGLLFSFFHAAFYSRLRKIKGPRLAAVTNLWRLAKLSQGDAPTLFRQLHNKYGKIVRIGPNHVSIADPEAIKKVYGIGSSYLKVGNRTTLMIMS